MLSDAIYAPAEMERGEKVACGADFINKINHSN